MYEGGIQGFMEVLESHNLDLSYQVFELWDEGKVEVDVRRYLIFSKLIMKATWMKNDKVKHCKDFES